MKALLRSITCVCLASSIVAAQDWPTRSVRVISPFAAGGSSDTVGRVIGEALSEKFGQQFVLENRGGAGGIIGSAQVAGSPPDGYTFLISSIGTHVIAPLTNAKAGYDPVTSFTNVAYVGGPPIVMVVHPSLGVKSLRDLLAVLKKQTEPMAYVSPGPGTLGHLVGEYWAEKEKVRLVHIAYKGSGQAMNDLVAGHVKLGSLTSTAALGQMKGGTVIPIAVSSARRMPGFESVPTLRELGYPDMAVTTWFGFAAPAGLPTSIATQMNDAIGAALDNPKVGGRLVSSGFELDKKSPAALAAYIKDELAKWAPLAKRLIATEGRSERGHFVGWVSAAWARDFDLGADSARNPTSGFSIAYVNVGLRAE
jgi:tripartite-type tricarboxylate transporter receptor subunit TctC